MQKPVSCDTFVALPPATANGAVVFGKNSDRPNSEIQEVLYFPHKDYTAGEKLQCTYIEIDQATETHAVILSKPSWMWGAEMGANEHGVCIGNEAVWTVLNGPQDLTEKLLGMDLLRLGLERSKTAEEALDVITSLLENHGQGGACSEQQGLTDWAYHNSFLIADGKEAWVLETAGIYWAAERVTEGVRNISNALSIKTKIDRMSNNLIEEATKLGFYKEENGPFDFSEVFSDGSSESFRFRRGNELLKELSSGGQFAIKEMCIVLRDEDSGICSTGGAFVTTSSQISVLQSGASSAPSCHWFTATPNTLLSLFKPFIFCPMSDIGSNTRSPELGDEDPAKIKPRFQKSVDREHPLYKSHKKLEELLGNDDPKGHVIIENLNELESKCMEDMEEIVKCFDEKSSMRVAPIFGHMVDLEMNFYK